MDGCSEVLIYSRALGSIPTNKQQKLVVKVLVQGNKIFTVKHNYKPINTHSLSLEGQQLLSENAVFPCGVL